MHPQGFARLAAGVRLSLWIVRETEVKPVWQPSAGTDWPSGARATPEIRARALELGRAAVECFCYADGDSAGSPRPDPASQSEGSQ